MKTTILACLSLTLLCATAYADTFGTGPNTFDIEFVSIGNADNPDDTTGSPNPAGKVEYAYRMGQFEISEDMIDKANNEGGLGITKDTRGPNKPATSVSWLEAATFVNWLNVDVGAHPPTSFLAARSRCGFRAIRRTTTPRISIAASGLTIFCRAWMNGTRRPTIMLVRSATETTRLPTALCPRLLLVVQQRTQPCTTSHSPQGLRASRKPAV